MLKRKVKRPHTGKRKTLATTEIKRKKCGIISILIQTCVFEHGPLCPQVFDFWFRAICNKKKILNKSLVIFNAVLSFHASRGQQLRTIKFSNSFCFCNAFNNLRVSSQTHPVAECYLSQSACTIASCKPSLRHCGSGIQNIVSLRW